MKKSIITALMILTIITCSVIPFSVKAAGNMVYATGGTFNEGEYNVYTVQASTGSYLQFYGFNQFYSFDQYHSAVVVKIDLNDIYTGDITLNFSVTYTTFALWWTECDSGSCGIDGINKQFILHINDCQSLTLYLCSNQTSTNGIQPISISTNLTKRDNSVTINPNYIQKFKFWINADDGNSGQWPIIIYTTDSLNSFAYFNTSLNNYSVRRLDAHFNYEINDGNFFVCTFYLKSSSSVEKWGTGWVGIRDFTGVNRNYSNEVYRYFYKTPVANNSYVYLCTLYIPIGLLSKSNNGYDWNLQLNSGIGYLENTTAVGWIYRGTVENIPDYVLNQSYPDNPNTDLNNTTNEISDLQSQENQIVSGFQDDLTEFNTNMDLSDYDFITGFQNSNNYFKMLLDNMYVNSSAVRAFWVIPVILVLFMAITGRK